MSRRLLLAGGGSGGFVLPSWTRGTVSPDGSPATILADGEANLFPGVVWLDDSRLLVVFNRWDGGVGDIYGTIGTKTGEWTFTWGTPFLIYHNAVDVLCDDPVSIVDDRVVIAARLYNGTSNYGSFLLRSAVDRSAVTSSSGWGSPISVPLTTYAADNLITGRVQRLTNGSYLVGYYGGHTGGEFAEDFETGVLISGSLTDWSARSEIVVGPEGPENFTEIDIEEIDGTLVAHLRGEVDKEHYVSTSDDDGATWTTPVSAFSAHGYPMFRRLTSGLRLTVYRDADEPQATMWRQSDDDGATWSAETTLDGTEIGGNDSTSAYASLVQLDDTHALVVYSITDERFLTHPANLYSQVFTDSSTFG